MPSLWTSVSRVVKVSQGVGGRPPVLGGALWELQMAYTLIDPVITAWADRHALKLFSEFGGEQRRFSYVSGGPQECFQISIEPPEEGEVSVSAWSMETIDDAELQESWRVTVDELATTLDLALAKIGAWTTRPKAPATWRPPSDWAPEG